VVVIEGSDNVLAAQVVGQTMLAEAMGRGSER
jgi:hypothetical protein